MARRTNTRRKARRAAVQVLFSMSFSQDAPADALRRYWSTLSEKPTSRESIPSPSHPPVDGAPTHISSGGDVHAGPASPEGQALENPSSAQQVSQGLRSNRREQDQVQSFGDTLVLGTCREMAVIDEWIQRFSKNWRIERMPRTDRAILRLAVFELLFMEEVPYNVTINEAVELAKEFSEPESTSFVNGVLDRIAKEAARIALEV